jgi:hypothetical protein
MPCASYRIFRKFYFSGRQKVNRGSEYSEFSEYSEYSEYSESQ